MVLRRIIWLAFAVALIVGSLQTVAHNAAAVPIIQAAELFEDQKQEVASVETHTHDAKAQGHDHKEPWKPANGFERQAWTWVANVNFAFALALLVFVVLGFRERRQGLPESRLRVGLSVALGGFVSMYVWPALGLPPEIPGMDAPVLGARQLWWLLAAGSSMTAFCVLAFSSATWRWIAAPALLALPFLIGPPLHNGDPFAGFSADAAVQLRALADRFIWASAASSLFQWLMLGGACAVAFKRWLKPLFRESALPAFAVEPGPRGG